MNKDIFYKDELNTKRIAAYHKLMEQWNLQEGTVRDLFCAGIDFACENMPKKKERNGVFIPPTVSAVMDYFFTNGYAPEAGKKAWGYYDAANWTDSAGKPVINWKQKVRGNWFRDAFKVIKPGERKPVPVAR
jgi:hypothetical protein